MQNGVVAEDCGWCPFWEHGNIFKFGRVQIATKLTAIQSTILVDRAMSIDVSSTNPELEATSPSQPLPPTPPPYTPSSPPPPPPAQPVANGDHSTIVIALDMQKDPLVDIPEGDHSELEAPLHKYLLDMPNPAGDAWDVDVALCWLDTGTVSKLFYIYYYLL